MAARAINDAVTLLNERWPEVDFTLTPDEFDRFCLTWTDGPSGAEIAAVFPGRIRRLRTTGSRIQELIDRDAGVMPGARCLIPGPRATALATLLTTAMYGRPVEGSVIASGFDSKARRLIGRARRHPDVVVETWVKLAVDDALEHGKLGRTEQRQLQLLEVAAALHR